MYVARLVLGSLLLFTALVVSNGAIELAFRDTATGTLGWGPSLFRGLLAFHGAAILFTGLRRRLSSPSHDESGLVRSPFVGGPAWVVLGPLTVVAVALRLWKLNTDLWIDEILTLVDLVRLPPGEIVTTFPNQNQHMLFSIMAKASVSWFGESAWSLRLPSVTFAIGSVWALYLLGRRVLGTREALIACTLMTFSYHHVWFSQNARGYMGLLFFATLSTYFWLEGLVKPWRGYWVGYTLSTALGMWVHLTMAFVVAGHGIMYTLLILFPRWDGGTVRARALSPATSADTILAWIFSASLTLQLYALSLPQFLREAIGEESLESVWTNPLWAVAEGLRSLQVGFSSTVVVLAGLTLVAVGWLSTIRKDVPAALSMTVPAVVCGVSVLALGHNLWPRFFFFCMGFALLIVVRGAMALPQVLFWKPSLFEADSRLASIAGVLICLLMIVASLASLPAYYALPKQDFTGAWRFVEEKSDGNGTVVAVGLAGMAYGRYYAPDAIVPLDRDDLEYVLRTHPPVWLVYTLPIELQTFHPELWDLVRNRFEVVRSFPGTLGGGDIYVCRDVRQ